LIGPQCRAFLTQLRQRILDGGYVNNQPTLDGDRRLPFVGVQRRLEAADRIVPRGFC
jgi:hypothetical protein